jgi:hypothetical protein
MVSTHRELTPVLANNEQYFRFMVGPMVLKLPTYPAGHMREMRQAAFLAKVAFVPDYATYILPSPVTR